MQNQNIENIEEHHIPETLERQNRSIREWGKTMVWGNKEEEEARWRQTSSRKPTVEKNHRHMETTAEEEKKTTKEQKEREKSNLHRYKMTHRKQRVVKKFLE